MKWIKASEAPKEEGWYYIKFGGTKRCAMFRDGDWEVPYPTDSENFLWLDETEEGQQTTDVEQAALNYAPESGFAAMYKREGFIAGAKWNQGKEAGETVKVDKSFKDYMRNVRNEFVREIDAQEWNTKLRTTAEDLLICFDQMRERLTSQPITTPSGANSVTNTSDNP